MNTELLKKLGNIDQLAGIRESTLLRGRGQGIRLAEFYNAAGLRFTVVPDRCMDLFDLSYKGVNLAFQSKNGLTSPLAYNAMDGEFAEQWPAGAMVTCGLDNVGGPSAVGGNFPTHGRTGHVPAKTFGTDTRWEGEDYLLTATGEMHQTKMFSRHLSLRRTVQTGLFDKTIRIHDVVTNFEATAEPYLMLYHINFGYPLLQADSKVAVSGNMTVEPVTKETSDYRTMAEPVPNCPEELYLHTVQSGDTAAAVIYHEGLGLGAYVRFDTKNLPGLLQWKKMSAHDYVVGLEPCNTYGCNRKQLKEQGRLPMLEPYTSAENRLEIGVLDGKEEIQAFLKAL